MAITTGEIDEIFNHSTRLSNDAIVDFV